MRYTSLENTPESFYDEIGFMSGLEVHQQLRTEKKLFCRCPAGLYSREWDAEILRHMRPTLSEMGVYDGTALMEFKTKKEIVYRLNNDTVCTYEFDDSPPFEINEQAVDITLEVTLLLNCNVVSELHIARKQYLDGSIPTGFQRTLISGVEGWIPYKGRKIGIIQISLEEDSCREVSDEGHVRTYITDRLGMPLIETVTYPDMKCPEDVAGVAQVIRGLNRATGKVRTGAGAARQDVNVSVRGGTRCEIKGVSSIKRIPLLVHNEAFRQVGLLEIKDALRKRGIDKDSFKAVDMDLSPLLKKCGYQPIRNALVEEKKVFGVLLRGYRGLLKHGLGAGRRFVDEISDRVRVIACLHHLPNILSDECDADALPEENWKQIVKVFDASEQDAIVLVWGDASDVDTALAEIVIRAEEAIHGVPNETRQPMPDGRTRFERILPGADRMYPDTDLQPKPIADEHIHALRDALPLLPWQREGKYRDLQLHETVVHELSHSSFADSFDRLIDSYSISPSALARVFVNEIPACRRLGLPVDGLDDVFLDALVSAAARGEVLVSALPLILRHCLVAREISGEADLSVYRPADESAVHSLCETILQQAESMTFHHTGDDLRWCMGRVQAELLGRVDGAVVAKKIATALKAGVGGGA